MPTRSQALTTALESIAVHDHLCLIYETREEQFAAVVPFIHRGLAAGERCVYIADDNTVEDVLAALRDDGIDTRTEVSRGALLVLDKRGSYLRDGTFDPDAMIAFLAAAERAAREDGFAALRVTGEMTWVLGGEPGTERLFEYEARLNQFFPGHDALAICQYSRARFSPDVMVDVIRTHPLVIFGERVCENPYYVPPDEFLLPEGSGTQAERMLDALDQLSRTRSALEEASRQWTATFDALNDAVCLLARDGTVLRCNRRTAALLGVDPDLVLGSKCYELMHGGDSFVTACPYLETLRSGERASAELERDGRWCHVTVDPLLDADGEVIGAVHVVRDVTDHHEAEEALRESESRGRFWAGIVERAADAVAVGYADGRIGDCNQAWCDLTGYTREELRAVDWTTALTPAEWRGPEREALAELERTGRPVRYEKEIVRKDGTRVPVELVVHPQGEPDGSGRYYIGFIRDVSERRRSEAHIRNLNAQLELSVGERTRELSRANRELRQLVYTVAHDLRTPLRAIDGFSLAVSERAGGDLDEDSLRDLERVRAATQRLGAVLDGMVALSSAGRRKPHVEPTDISALAAQVDAELRALQPERLVEVTIEEGLTAITDPLLAEIVLANLLDNAWKSTAGRPVAHITVGAIVRNGRRAFYVRDDGVGFDPAFSRKLFSPFESLHDPHEFPGTGVGLATVARTVEVLGGTCWADGRPGEGATFYFMLSDAAELE